MPYTCRARQADVLRTVVSKQTHKRSLLMLCGAISCELDYICVSSKVWGPLSTGTLRSETVLSHRRLAVIAVIYIAQPATNPQNEASSILLWWSYQGQL